MNIKEKYGFIYITTNHINNMKYIGQRKFNAQGSWERYLGSGVALNRAIKKHGKENFSKEIIAYAESQEELDNLEVKIIREHNAVESREYYNIASGGKTGYTGNPFINKTEEEMNAYRKKMSELKKGEKNGRWKGGITRIKKQRYYKGENKSKSKGGERYRSFGFKGKKHSEETKKLLSKQRQGANNNNAKKVICITTGKKFDCVKDAAEFYGIKTRNNISQCLTGKQRTAGKFNGERLEWAYAQ